MEKETIEEAKNTAWNNYEHVEGNLYSSSFKNGFEIGAKWQQEQDKNKFSEKDMINVIKYTINNFFNGKLAGLNSEEIFEQFKTKK